MYISEQDSKIKLSVYSLLEKQGIAPKAIFGNDSTTSKKFIPKTSNSKLEYEKPR